MSVSLPFAAAFALVLAFGGLVAGFLWLRLKALLLFFQQEEYDGGRFLRWVRRAGARDRLTSIGAAVGAAVGFADGGFWQTAGIAIVAFALAVGIRRSRGVLVDAKKALVMTARARRILWLAFLLAVAAMVALALAGWRFGAAVAHPAVLAGLLVLTIARGAPRFLTVANRLLAPYEGRLQARLLAEAKARLAELRPTVVAVTGSFGKTSTKHVLAHLLQSLGPTLMTPGSVNTPMGVTRVIREDLKPGHRFFVVEMGAYGPGSIRRLTELCPPDLGLLTAVGEAHYERFRSLATVARAKMELAEAVFARGGVFFVATDAIGEPELRARLEKGAVPAGGGALVRVGRAPDAEWRLLSLEEGADGLRLRLRAPGVDGEVTLEAPIHGRHQALNILLAVAAAHRLGLPLPAIRAALRSLPQIPHRLAVSRTRAGLTVIDDAYNSNPRGFMAALDLLDLIGREHGGRRILLTPGMVELGERHDEAHREVGRHAFGRTDLILLVGAARFPAFEEGVREAADAAGAEAPGIRRFARQAEAEAWLAEHARPGDAVLIENNLPDLYERRVRF